jgi:hypothetical protein
VRDGSQKSGSLARRASACSFSSCKRASSSASWVRRSTSVVSNSNFRFFPRAAWLGHPASRRHVVENDPPESVVEGVTELELGVEVTGFADSPK